MLNLNIVQNLDFLKKSIEAVKMHYFSIVFFHQSRKIDGKKAQANSGAFLNKTDKELCWLSLNSSKMIKAINLGFYSIE